MSLLVGIVFIVTSLLKTFYSRLFINHVNRLNLFPDRLGPLLAILFIELEAGLGVGLILRVYPHLLIPFSLVLIVVMSGVTLWAIHNGRVDDCGCYGDLMTLSLPQTLFLNLLYCILLGLDYYSLSGNSDTHDWKLYLLVGVILGVHFLAKRSVFNPLFDLAGVKVGNRWGRGWFGLEEGSVLPTKTIIFLLDSRCSQCVDWWDRLSVLETESVTEQIVLLVSRENGNRDRFKGELTIPVFNVEGLRIKFLLGRLPMAVLVEDGVIRKVWTKSFPSF